MNTSLNGKHPFPRRAALLCLLLTGILFLLPFFALAAEPAYTNPETGYRVILEDDADLLSASEERELLAVMQSVTEFGNVAFRSIDTNRTTTASYARSYYHEQFGSTSGTLFLIDMDNRDLYIFSDGDIYRVVTRSRAETITDNIYRMASRGDYFACTREAYSQIYAILNGNRIAQPMKYISNALLAVLLALLANFLLIGTVSRLRQASFSRILRAASASFRFTEPEAVYVNTTKTYSPIEVSDSGGSGGSSSGGGGGGSSGGGGGHSF